MHVVAPLAQRNSRPALQDLEAVGLRGFAEPRDVLRRSARPRRVVPNADHCDHQHANSPSAATTATPHVLYSYRARAPRATRQERQAAGRPAARVVEAELALGSSPAPWANPAPHPGLDLEAKP